MFYLVGKEKEEIRNKRQVKRLERKIKIKIKGHFKTIFYSILYINKKYRGIVNNSGVSVCNYYCVIELINK